MKSANEDITHPTSSAVVQIGRLNPQQVRNLAETIGAAFLYEEYAEGNFIFSEDWRDQFREFLNTGTVHENITQTAELLTSPNPVINRFGDAIAELDVPLIRGDVRQAYQYMLEVDNGVSNADRQLLAQWINGRADNNQAINTLITPNNQLNLQAFFVAASTGNNDYIIDLVNNIDPDTMLENLSLVDNEGNTALHLAALNGHAAVVETLANAGANIEYRNNAGENAIHAAVRGGSTNALETILNYDEVSVNQHNNAEQTPIMLTDNQEIRDMLLARGAQEERRKQPRRSPSPASVKRSRFNYDKDRDNDNSGDGFVR